MKSILEFRENYRFLSNFWPVQVQYCGKFYPTVENAFQAAKTLDKREREAFIEVSPGKAKGMGKALSLRPEWDKIKVAIMFKLIVKKFGDDGSEELVRALLDTGDAQLVEGNQWKDNFWGTCPVGSVCGQNWLGKLLMLRRSQLMLSGSLSRLKSS